MIKHQFEGTKKDREAFIDEMNKWVLTGEDQTYLNKAHKRLVNIGVELIDNKVKYSSDEQTTFRYTVVEDDQNGKISAIWQDISDATGERLDRLKSKFENAVALSEQGRDALKKYKMQMLSGELENSAESISKGSAGVGFVDMAMKSEKMEGNFRPINDKHSRVSFKFEL